MNGLSETHSNTCLPIRCKACLFHSDFIGVDSKLLGSKETLFIRCYSSRLIGQRVAQRNFRVGNDSATGVAHNALKSCSNSRRLSGSVGRAKQQGERYGDPDSNMTHGKRTASQNHLESPSTMNCEEQRNMSWLSCKDGPSRRRQRTELLLNASWDLLSQTSRYAVGGDGDSSHQKTAK